MSWLFPWGIPMQSTCSHCVTTLRSLTVWSVWSLGCNCMFSHNCHFAVTVRLLCSHCAVTVWSLCDPCVVTLRLLCSNCAVTVWSLCDPCVVTLWSLCGHCVVTVRSLCGHCAVTVQSLCGHCAVIVRSLCDHCAVIVRLLVLPDHMIIYIRYIGHKVWCSPLMDTGLRLHRSWPTDCPLNFTCSGTTTLRQLTRPWKKQTVENSLPSRIRRVSKSRNSDFGSLEI